MSIEQKSRYRRRVWFSAPQFYWYGWATLKPMWFGNAEPCDRQLDGTHYGLTLVIGWTITGRIVFWLADLPLPEDERFDPQEFWSA
jgi:hypothetical protein